MKKSLGTLLVGVALVVVSMLAIPTSVSAAPAITHRGTLCFVEDANGVQYTVTCEYHWVIKYDDAGNLSFMEYQDHAMLPEGAALPTTTLHSIFHASCGGCVFEGDYEQILTPNGVYMSHGPIRNGS